MSDESTQTNTTQCELGYCSHARPECDMARARGLLEDVSDAIKCESLRCTGRWDETVYYSCAGCGEGRVTMHCTAHYLEILGRSRTEVATPGPMIMCAVCGHETSVRSWGKSEGRAA